MSVTSNGSHGMAAGGPERIESARVESELELSLVLSPEWAMPLKARFTYRTDDPYAVHLDFYPGTPAAVHWVFARELLTTGTSRPVGSADVRVWPAHGHLLVFLCLASPDGDALLMVPAAALAPWLRRTHRLVPPGQEGRFLDLDRLLERLLRCTEASGHSEPDGRWEEQREQRET